MTITRPGTGIASPRGSEWHRWDPHLHAPGTALNDQFGGQWDEYLTAIEQSSPRIHALGITDYYSIRTYQEVRAQKVRGRLPDVGLIFPNVEIRLSIKTERTAVNFHLLFSPIDPNHVSEIEGLLAKFHCDIDNRRWHCAYDQLVALGKKDNQAITDDQRAFEAGANLFKVDFDDLCDLHHRDAWFREHCLFAVAGGSDGTSGLQREDSFRGIRANLERRAHIIFSNNATDRNFWLGETSKATPSSIERRLGALKPCLVGSDAHKVATIRDLPNTRMCWIKGDLTFDGLRQAVVEPAERVFIGGQSPEAETPPRAIQAVLAQESPWLGTPNVPINTGMVAIIGPRGSGKTALSELVAAGGGALPRPLPKSSFLNRARDPDDLLGDCRVELHWRDGTKTSAPFEPPNDWVDEDTPLSAVRYLSQQFVDQLCSGGGLATGLRDEIERVIFEQTPPTERHGTATFSELRDFLVGPIRERRQGFREAVNAYCDRIADEKRIQQSLARLEAEQAKQEAHLLLLRKELEGLVPELDPTLATRLQELEVAFGEVTAAVATLKTREKSLVDLKEAADLLRTHGEPERYRKMRAAFGQTGLSEGEWDAFRLRFDGDPAAVIDQALKRVRQDIGRTTSDPDAEELAKITGVMKRWPLDLLSRERDAARKLAGLEAERLQKYQERQKTLREQVEAIKRRADDIVQAKGAGDRLRQLKHDRQEAYRSMFATFEDEYAILERLYQPLQLNLASAEGALAKMRFVIRRSVDLAAWAEPGESMLDLRSRGAFQGRGELARQATGVLLQPWRFGSAEDAAAAVERFMEQYGDDFKIAMPSQERRDGGVSWLQRLGTWMFGVDHISIAYALEYEGVPIERLSPGTRGVVLLLLYLAIDTTDRRPLLIDQPEDNLDPYSVQQDLVPHFREARKRRQIIIVTHNANLVVNTDVDQVIIASAAPAQAGRLPEIRYRSGALEHPEIRNAVCAILEGGERAFLERERRYRLHWESVVAPPSTTT